MTSRFGSRVLRFADDQHGASAVEFALVAPLFLFVFLGFVQLGAALFTYHSLALAGEQGARHLLLAPKDKAGAVSAVNEAAEATALDTSRLRVTARHLNEPNPHIELTTEYTYVMPVPLEELGAGFPMASLAVVPLSAN